MSGIFILAFFIALPAAGLIWFIYNCNRFFKAVPSQRWTVKYILPLVISFFPAAFAVFILVFIIGIFTGAISLM